MAVPYTLSVRFAAVLDPDEEILWAGKPECWPFLLHALPFALFGLGWLIAVLAFVRFLASSGAQIDPGIAFLGAAGFLMVSGLDVLRLLVVYHNTAYAVTNKRIMTRSGFWGASFHIVDYDQISDSAVAVGLFDYLFNTGTIRCSADPSPAFSEYPVFLVPAGNRFYHIRRPYDVFKLIKGTTVDVKTDWSFPNAFRPDENPGYSTRYRPR